MLFQIEQDIDILLAPKAAESSGVYAHEIKPFVVKVLENYTFKQQLVALGEIEGAEDLGNYAQTLRESVSRVLIESLTDAAGHRLAKTQLDFKETKEKLLNAGYTLVDYFKEAVRYYAMVKLGDPAEFFTTEYEAIMYIGQPVEDILEGTPV